MLTAWTNYLNTIHATGGATSNQVQNQGLAVIAEMNEYVGNVNIAELINRRLRNTLTNARPYMELWNEFLVNVEEGKSQTIELLTNCDRMLIEDFTIVAEDDLIRARRCQDV